MFITPKLQSPSRNFPQIFTNLVPFCLFGWLASINSLEAQTLALWGKPTCAVEPSDRTLKDNLRKTNNSAYPALIAKHKDQITECRSQDPIKTQALWLRLYAKDTKPEVLADVLDRIVNRGYNTVFVDVFYDGQILLPVSDNPTPWRSLTAEAVKAGKVAADFDLWAEVIRQGRDRGLKVYGRSFAMDFGYSYSQIPDRASVLAVNGRGETSISKSQLNPNANAVTNGKASNLEPNEADRVFIDPYNSQARSDFAGAIASLLKRQPDGILFDYLRYPLSKGLANNVKDLWIYGEAARNALLASMPDAGTKQLMAIYLAQGEIPPKAIAMLQETQQKITGMTQVRSKNPAFAAKLSEKFLWQLAVNHAYQGVLDFANVAIASINLTVNSTINSNKNSGSKPAIGAVFSLNGNAPFWNRFPLSMERHPMTYALCDDGKCVANEVIKVINASPKAVVCPVLAGTWGQSWRGHPSLETQMQAIRAVAPQINCISHFSYEWVEPESDQERKAGL